MKKKKIVKNQIKYARGIQVKDKITAAHHQFSNKNRAVGHYACQKKKKKNCITTIIRVLNSKLLFLSLGIHNSICDVSNVYLFRWFSHVWVVFWRGRRVNNKFKMFLFPMPNYSTHGIMFIFFFHICRYLNVLRFDV